MPACLLDTDMLSEVIKQKHPVVLRKAVAYLQTYQQFSFSSITRYEVVRGLKAKNASRQLGKFATFCQHSLIVGINDAVLDRAADLWVIGNQRGFPKKDADLIIAATALLQGRTLVTGKHESLLLDSGPCPGGLASTVALRPSFYFLVGQSLSGSKSRSSNLTGYWMRS